MNGIDLGRAFKAPFNDEKWVNKTLMGFLWGLLVVTSPAVIGAMLDYIKGVSAGREDLPEWDNFGDKWVRGLLVVVAGFIYFLPVVVIGMLFIVPGVIAAVSGGGDAAGGLLGAGACMFWLIALVYGVAVSVLYYGALTNYAMKGTFGALFEFGAILEKVRGGTGYWNAWLFSLVIGFGMSAISSILSATGIGGILYPAVLYLGYMMVGHLFGQWSARAYGVVAAAPVATPTYAPPAPPAPPAPTYAPPAAPAATPPVPPAPPAPPAVTPDLAPPAPPAAPVAAPPAPPASPAAPIESPAASEVAEAPAPEAAPEAPAAKEADENA